ncbi:MAG: molybdopterin-binding protein, partial [Phycisphaerae bacterium]
MRAVTLSIGSELVAGLVLDAHAQRLARALGGRGVEVVRHETLDDDVEAIAAAFTAAAREADLVVA